MYDLHQLGWYSFQQLSLTVASEIFGQTTLSFLSSGDGGRDGCFAGKWIPNGREEIEGQFVFQCKFTGKPSYNLRVSDLKEEIPKVEALVKKGLCDIYIVITNAGVSGNIEAKLRTTFKSIGVKHIFVFGSTWLFQHINESIRLRRLVPRLYGLGDLSQILDERVFSQGRALLESLKEELAKVVITNAYQKAADALDKHGFVLLVGEPAAGKTTIASLLAMGALDQWKAPTLKLNTAEQVVKHWNPDDPFKFYWIDDAFGVTQYEENLVRSWNHVMGEIKSILKNGSKIVMTSRDYIYNSARKDLKESVFPLLKESQVVIDVHNLTILEKRQMLYNHLKMGSQPLDFRKEIKPHLEFIAALPRFIPETARRIASPFFTKNLYLYQWHLEEFVTKQETFLVEVLQGLDKDCEAALALIYMNSDNLASPLTLNSQENNAIAKLGSDLGGCVAALNAMKGNLVQFLIIEGEQVWKFKHPTIGDAFSVHVVQSPELIEIYLQGSPIEKLMEQVTCGDVGLEKAVIVPKSFFSLILKRLKNFTATKAYKTHFLSIWGAKRQLQQFLASRCSGEFLVKYVEDNPEILDQVAKPGLSLDAVSEVELAYKLHHFKLFPETRRKEFVQTVTTYAVAGQDMFALKSEKIGSLFTNEEMDNLRNRISMELIPTLSQLTHRTQISFDHSNDEPDDHMRNLLESYEILLEEFEEDSKIAQVLTVEIETVNDWIEAKTTTAPEMIKREKLSVPSTSPSDDGERSIFDDIDII